MKTATIRMTIARELKIPTNHRYEHIVFLFFSYSTQQDCLVFQVIFPPSSKPTTPIKTRSVNSTPSKVEAKSGLRLVSYHDDTVISDDENDDDLSNNEDIEMETSDREADADAKENNENEAPVSEPKRDRFAEYGFVLPPEPKGKCAPELQDKITKMYEKMRTNNMDMNKLIQERKEFRNPSIYEKLIQFCDINELGTNYPPELYDPMQWTSKFLDLDLDLTSGDGVEFMELN